MNVGLLQPGLKNAITDVKGVTVGHQTLSNDSVQTGVTAVLGHDGNLFKEKLPAAYHVINGFGKSAGTVQINELGTLETPILLTNTLSVGTVSDALMQHMLEQNPEIGISTGTVNPVVCECNDGFLNDIRGQHVTTNDVFAALERADSVFEEGAVGAGTGMGCFGFKGGIGTASRMIEIDDSIHTLGVLVLTNYGIQKDFILNGKHVGKLVKEKHTEEEREKGSIIVLLATDIPLSQLQLKRVTKRTSVGIARTGSFTGNGSGEIAIGFSTAYRIPHFASKSLIDTRMLHDDYIDPVFRAAAEATEEAVLNSMISAETTIGRDGNRRVSLNAYADLF